MRQGKEYERAKYRELEQVFGDLVVRGEFRPHEPDEDRAFESINLETVIDGLAPNELVLEAQYPIADSFVRPTVWVISRMARLLRTVNASASTSSAPTFSRCSLRCPTRVVGSSPHRVPWIASLPGMNGWVFESSTSRLPVSRLLLTFPSSRTTGWHWLAGLRTRGEAIVSSCLPKPRSGLARTTVQPSVGTCSKTVKPGFRRLILQDILRGLDDRP